MPAVEENIWVNHFDCEGMYIKTKRISNLTTILNISYDPSPTEGTSFLFLLLRGLNSTPGVPDYVAN